MPKLVTLVQQMWQGYRKETPDRIMVLDVFMAVLAYQTAVLLAYVFLVGTFPFNSFLSALAGSAGTLSLTACLRVQVVNFDDFPMSTERKVVDYLLANLCLHMGCICFLG